MTSQEREGLRTLVRDVIREALAETRRPGGPAAADGVEPVRLASDADLDAFVRRIVGLMRDPATAARVESGELRFTLGNGRAGEALSGLVTERAIDAQPEGATLRLASDAVVTPLARDRARQRRIKLERAR
jgi:hypothetical protein